MEDRSELAILIESSARDRSSLNSGAAGEFVRNAEVEKKRSPRNRQWSRLSGLVHSQSDSHIQSQILQDMHKLDTKLAEEKASEKLGHVKSLKDLDKHIVKESPRVRSPRKNIRNRQRKQSLATHTFDTFLDTKSESYLAEDLQWEDMSKLTQACAAACIKNIMNDREYILREANLFKLWLYNVMSSRTYEIMLLGLSIFHVLLAVFEPSVEVNELKYQHGMNMWTVFYVEVGVLALYFLDLATSRFLTTHLVFFGYMFNIWKIAVISIMISDSIVFSISAGETPRYSRFLRPIMCFMLSRTLYDKALAVLKASLVAGRALFLLLFVIVVFSVAGMELFGDSQDWIQFADERHTCGFDFRDVYHSFAAMYVLLTTENYPCLMMPAIRGTLSVPKRDAWIETDGLNLSETSIGVITGVDGKNYTELTSSTYEYLKESGYVRKSRIWYSFYFVVFLLVTTFGVLNILVASIYTTYRQHHIQVSYQKRMKERKTLLIAYELLTMNKLMQHMEYTATLEDDKETCLDYLSFRELVHSVLGKQVDETKLKYYWKKIDEDSSGFVDPLEFLNLVDVLGLTLFQVCETNLAMLTHTSVWRSQLKRLTSHTGFTRTIFLVVLINTLMLCGKGCVSARIYGIVLIVNDAFSLVYLLEMILKVLAYGKEYFKGVWNQYDFIATILGVISLVLHRKLVKDWFDDQGHGTIVVAFSMLAKVTRMMRVLTVRKKQNNQLLLLLFKILPTTLDFVVLTFLLLCIYAYIGIEVFTNFSHDSTAQEDYYNYASFANFSSAIMLMFQVLTSSNWHEILLKGQRSLEVDMHPNLAFGLSCLYFMTFTILAVNIVLHVMQAVFVDSWRQILDMNRQLKKRLLQARHSALLYNQDGVIHSHPNLRRSRFESGDFSNDSPNAKS